MALARFKIQDKQQEVKQVEKSTLAGVFFSIKVNGIEQMPEGTHNVVHESLCIYLGKSYNHEISTKKLYLTHYGWTMARSQRESDLLLSWKPLLEEMLAKLARQL